MGEEKYNTWSVYGKYASINIRTHYFFPFLQLLREQL